MRVSRVTLGTATDSNFTPPVPTGAAGAFWSAGMTARMLAMPICGLFLGSGRLPVAQPSTAGGPAQTETWCLPPSTRSRIWRAPPPWTSSASTPRNWSRMPRRSPTSCSVAPAPREADSQPPKRRSRSRSRPGSFPTASASRAATSWASVKPPAGPSRATSSNGTFWPTAIITCCSLALGPRETSVTFDPGTRAARLAAS